MTSLSITTATFTGRRGAPEPMVRDVTPPEPRQLPEPE
jgi:hypothetical protein